MYILPFFFDTTDDMPAGHPEDIGHLPQQENAAHSRTESRRNQPAMVLTPPGIFMLIYKQKLLIECI
jgi:hypothetical protein